MSESESEISPRYPGLHKISTIARRETVGAKRISTRMGREQLPFKTSHLMSVLQVIFLIGVGLGLVGQLSPPSLVDRKE